MTQRMSNDVGKKTKEVKLLVMRYLIIGAGSMGTLHASYLLNEASNKVNSNKVNSNKVNSNGSNKQRIQIEVALLDRPGIPLHKPFGYIPLLDRSTSTISNTSDDDGDNDDDFNDDNGHNNDKNRNKTNEEKNLYNRIKKLNAKIVDINEAKKFLSECSKEAQNEVTFGSTATSIAISTASKTTIKCGIISCVKVHDIPIAFKPIEKEIQNHVSAIILLHNGLRNASIDSYLSTTFTYNHSHDSNSNSNSENRNNTSSSSTASNVNDSGRSDISSCSEAIHDTNNETITKEVKQKASAPISKIRLYNMVTCAGGTLLTKDELKKVHDEYDHGIDYTTVVKATGPGPSFIFPMENDYGKQYGDGRSNDDGHGDSYDDNNEHLQVVNVAVEMIPNSKLLSSHEGRCEQVLKLCINISLNGLLARRALKDWYQYYIHQQCQTQKQEEVGGSILKSSMRTVGCHNDSYNTTAAPHTLVHKVINHEMCDEVPLACSIARVILGRACLADPTNPQLKKALEEDSAAKITYTTFTKVPNNVCSTVVDICSNRKTEGHALLDTAMQEWPRLPSEEDGTCISTKAASNALNEITTMLNAWDDHII